MGGYFSENVFYVIAGFETGGYLVNKSAVRLGRVSKTNIVESFGYLTTGECFCISKLAAQ